MSSIKQQEKRKQQQQQQPILTFVVWCILITETAERVAYFGFRAVLVLYFTMGLKFDDSTAISLFAAVTALAYLSPVVGATLGDGEWGRFNTILRFGIIYASGLCLLTTSAFLVPTKIENENQTDIDDKNSQITNDKDNDKDNYNLTLERSLTFFGLLLACLGSGGIKPCVSAFGADQVTLSDSNSETNNKDAETIKNEYYDQQDNNNNDDNYSSHYNDSADDSIDNGDYHLKQSKNDDDDDDDDDDDTVLNNYNNNEKELRVRAFFAIFYFCINVGAVTSFAFIPLLRAHYGFHAALLVPTIFMTFAMILFWSQRHKYKYPTRSQQEGGAPLGKTFLLCGSILRQRIVSFFVRTTSSSQSFLGHPMLLSPTETTESSTNQDDQDSYDDTASENHNENENNMEEFHDEPIQQQQQQQQMYQDACQALHILPILLNFIIFWMLYDQQGSVWVLQAKRMALHGFLPEQLNVLNPLEIVIFVPLFERVIYPYLERRNWNLAPLNRIQCGMLFASSSFLWSGLLELYMQHFASNHGVHVAWQIPQVTILAIGEILLNVTGLEFAYAQAPSQYQSFILAIYLLMTAIGDGLAAIFYATVFRTMNPAMSMLICSLLLFINWCVFYCFVIRDWKPYSSSIHNIDTTNNIANDENEKINNNRSKRIHVNGFYKDHEGNKERDNDDEDDNDNIELVPALS